jgi:hypothetical protein
MKRLLSTLLVVAILMNTSCSKYTQIFQTKPTTSGITSSDRLYFENDTVKITYSFWQKGGTLVFSIYNKLNIPLYIDWKKSSFVKDGQKINYWSDETITHSSASSVGRPRSGYGYSSYGYYGLLGLSSSSTAVASRSIKPERITFLAPQSNIIEVMSNPLYPYTGDKFKRGAMAGSLTKQPSHMLVPIDFKEFNQSNSPLSFRNFLTISTTERFDNEVYIDNGFFVSRISQMKRSDFLGRTQYDHGTIYEMPFKGPSLFYIDAR